jgi:Putative beta-lactamase-inhibitor-like, PepSY-like
MRIAFLVSITLLSFQLCAQVPALVEQAFTKKFSSATQVKWERESDTEYEANFKLDDVHYSANFSSDGKWLETESPCTYEELPADVLSAFEITFPGKSPRHVYMIQTSELKILWELEILDGLHRRDLLYYPDGKLYQKE